MGIRICPECGGKVSTTRNDCPHCGYRFNDTKVCPECNENIEKDLKECPICGYVFNDLVDDNVSSNNEINNDAKQEISNKDITNINNTAVEVDNKSDLKCPYCDSDILIPIGIDYYMCNTCKGKFLDTKKGDFKPNIVERNNAVIPNVIETQEHTESKDINITNDKKNNFNDIMEKVNLDNNNKSDDEVSENIVGKNKIIVIANIIFIIILVIFNAILIRFTKQDYRYNMYDILPIQYNSFLIICSLATILSVVFLIISLVKIKRNNSKDEESNREKPFKGLFFSLLISIFSTLLIISLLYIDGKMFNDDGKTCLIFAIVSFVIAVICSLLCIKYDKNHSNNFKMNRSIIAYAFVGLLSAICFVSKIIHSKNNVLYIDDGCIINLNVFGKEKRNIRIPNSVTIIGYGVFANCSRLTSISIPNSVTIIEPGAFSNCSGLTSITIPNSVTRIGDSIFYDCSGLTSIIIPNSVTSIGDSAFYNCSKLTSITIPNSVTNIEPGAFSNCSGLTSITISNDVTKIAKSTFLNCSRLTNITIPNSVIDIDDYAFNGCSNLTSITIPDSVTRIGYSAFGNCTCEILWGDNPSITTIGEYAFYRYKGTSITIPNSVTSIGYNAFADCNISIAYYNGTMEEWLNIGIYSGNESLSNSIYYYSESEPSEPGNYWHYVDGKPTVWS